ncbi:MAG: flavodoxin family protein [Sphaerochaetaceae bacterium]|nr:flavodoxin family protein [Sphaerochaetaceae bacterium]MDD4006839.1 flavodoxin family protein [Sphaerochaetaceae bacterium]
MKVLMINGSPHERGCTYTALAEIAKTLDKHGIESEILYLGTKPVAGCIACGNCRKTGKCIFDDKVNYVIENLDQYQAIVVGSPVYYASASGQVVSFLDRLFHSSAKRMAGKLGAAIVSCRRGGATASFDELNKYFSISNMIIVTSQYWNMIHGNTPEEASKDIEGLQTMRTLGENIAWLLNCLDAARKAGVPAPVYEKQIATNYIR